jgi:pyruvate ferredoxin oxidoreductase gamma subunit
VESVSIVGSSTNFPIIEQMEISVLCSRKDFLMDDLIEIRWHGRGGQGAKTASLLLADAAFNTGKFIQGFPEYGPERMGAPITAYNRISSKPITIHSNIYDPNYVVVVDDSLLETVNVTARFEK